MAGRLHQLVLAASFVALLAASASSSWPAPAAAVHGAGEGRGWTVPSPPRNGSGEMPSQWAARQRFHVGDVLDFKNWNGSVLVVRRGDYDNCSAASPVFRFANDRNATGTRFMLGLSGRGSFYFIAAAPARCKAGERMAVRVAARYDSAISAGPAAAPAEEDVPPAAPDQSVPSDKPWKMAAYAVLGFLAGALASFCCLFFLVRCCSCCGNQN